MDEVVVVPITAGTYRKFYPHPHGITMAAIPIFAGIPPLLSPLLQ